MKELIVSAMWLPIVIAALAVSLASMAPQPSQAASLKDPVRVEPAPAGEPLSALFAVAVDGQNAPAYVAKVLCIDRVRTHELPEVQLPGEAAFASFDMGRSPVTVTVTCAQDVQAAKLLPSSYHLTPNVEGNTVTFTISKPGQVTLEVNGDWNDSLHIFANPYEADIPSANDPNVIYFGPGVHEIEPVTVYSGQTVYIAAGAVVYGKLSSLTGKGTVFTLSGSNITLRGRGIIDGSLIPKPSPGGNLIFAHGSDIHVEGVILRDSGGWNFPIYDSQRVTVDNLKLFGWRGNSDGIDINNSSDIDVADTFFRTFDDNVVIKSSNPKAPPTRNVTAKRCISWNEIAHPFSLGAELNNDCENITFSDCDVIHDKGREWVLRVFNSGKAHVKNVVFDNIRIEEARRPISLWIGSSMWVKDPERGHIDDVVFRNITSVLPEGGNKCANLVGFDADHAIHNVKFENVLFGGKPVTADDVKQNAFVDGVTFEP
ncbi:MAG: glycosyl hydrolase family 28 protein [Capsulimonadaceae bacterium]|nr:glycosyl hydrolase family 28 protein [Capsulimonadaceae bacterium]